MENENEANGSENGSRKKPEFINFDKFDDKVETTLMIFENGASFSFSKKTFKELKDEPGKYESQANRISIPFDSIKEFKEYFIKQCDAAEKYRKDHPEKFHFSN